MKRSKGSSPKNSSGGRGDSGSDEEILGRSKASTVVIYEDMIHIPSPLELLGNYLSPTPESQRQSR